MCLAVQFRAILQVFFVIHPVNKYFLRVRRIISTKRDNGSVGGCRATLLAVIPESGGVKLGNMIKTQDGVCYRKGRVDV